MSATAIAKAKQAAENAPALVQGKKLEDLVKTDQVKKRFEEVMGRRAAGFIASVLSLYSANDTLKAANPMSILSSAMIAATLDLPINSNLGFAHLVPYGGKCTFQIGWRGLVQLALRTGQYKNIGVSEVFEGELKSFNRITGDIDIDPNGKASEKVLGYLAFFRLVNGFEKFYYMTVEQIEAHGKRFSKSYALPAGQWKQNFDGMAKKTVLKLMLSKWGILSVDMHNVQKAIEADEGTPASLDEPEVIDYPDGKAIEPEIAPVKAAGDLLSAEEKEQILQAEKEMANKKKTRDPGED